MIKQLAELSKKIEKLENCGVSFYWKCPSNECEAKANYKNNNNGYNKDKNTNENKNKSKTHANQTYNVIDHILDTNNDGTDNDGDVDMSVDNYTSNSYPKDAKHEMDSDDNKCVSPLRRSKR